MDDKQTKDTTTREPAAGSKSPHVLAVEQLLLGDLSEEEIDLRLREDLQDLLVANSLGIDSSAASLHRYVPAEIYVPGAPDAVDMDFFLLVMALLEFVAEIGWKIHNAGPVQYSSLRAPLILRTGRIEWQEWRQETEILDTAIADGIEKAKDKKLAREEKEAKIALTKEQTKFTRAKRWGIYVTAVGALLAALESRNIPDSYIQIGTTRIEMKSGGIRMKTVPSSEAFAIVHLPPKTSGGTESGEKK